MTAEEWVLQFCDQNKVDWEALTPAERFHITMLVPCSVRCFRVGAPTDIGSDNRCMECSKENQIPSRWDRLLKAAE